MGTNPGSKRCPYVSFSGMDGAGKSTQIENLYSSCTEAGLRVRVITFWDDIACLTSVREAAGHTVFKGDKGVGTPSAPINRRDKNVQSSAMSGVRLGLYCLDALSLKRVIERELRSGADLLICDRYIYDELANLTLSHPAARAYIRMMMRFVPRPDISFVLDADPVAARARKPEYPLDFLYRNREAYLALANLVGGITVIPPLPIAEVQRKIRQDVMQLCPLEMRGERPLIQA